MIALHPPCFGTPRYVVVSSADHHSYDHPIIEGKEIISELSAPKTEIDSLL